MPLDGTDRAVSLDLQGGDILALISDGVYEYTAEDGSQFGEERVAGIMREHHQLPMAELTRKLVEGAKAFGGDAPQADDITVVLVRRLPT
jgi:sigma-B regulation protein RsbU (phosphoserine phosphatase)